MPNPPTRSIYLPNYKVAVDVPSGYTDEQIDDAVRRNKAAIQAQSPVSQQTAANIQRNTSELGITPQQARSQGIVPAVQGSQAGQEYGTADQSALARHYASVKAINSANQHPNSTAIVQGAQKNLLPPDQFNALSAKAGAEIPNFLNKPVLNYLLDYGAPGASNALAQMDSFGARVAQGVSGATTPLNIAGAIAAGPALAGMGRASQTGVLLGLGATSVPSAVQDAQAGNYGGALGSLAAGFAPAGLHAILPPMMQGLTNRFPDFGFPGRAPVEAPTFLPPSVESTGPLGEAPLPINPDAPLSRWAAMKAEAPPTVTEATPPLTSAERAAARSSYVTDPAVKARAGAVEFGNDPTLPAPVIDPTTAGQTLQMEQAPVPKVKSKYGLKGYEAQRLADAFGVTTDAPVSEVAPRVAPDIAAIPMATVQQQGVPQNAQQPIQQFAPAPAPMQTAAAVPAASVANAPPIATDMAQTAPAEANLATAPVVSARVETAYTADNNPVQFRYAAVPGDSLHTSHKDTGSALDVNPGYDQTLQPRDRSRMASLAQVDTLGRELNPTRLGASPTTYDGAPIVGPDLHVESGNARTLGILRHTASGDAAGYGDYVRSNASAFGLDPAAVAQVKNPVLVRMRNGQTTPQQRSSLAEEMGRSPVASMSTIEQATGDAKKLRSSGILSQLRPTESGDIGAENTGFARSFLRHVVPAAEHGTVMQENGHISAAGQQRIRNAILAAAYHDHGTLSRMLESTDENTRTISRAMLAVAPHLVDIQDKIKGDERYSLDIAPALAESANMVSHLRDRGIKVRDFLAQQNMFGDDLSPIARELLRLMDLHARSGKKLTDILKAYVDLAHKAGDPRNGKLFEEVGAPTQEDILDAAVRTATGDTADLFGRADTTADQAEPAASRHTDEARPVAAAVGSTATLVKPAVSGGKKTTKPPATTGNAPTNVGSGSARLTLTAGEATALSSELGDHPLAARLDDMFSGSNMNRKDWSFDVTHQHAPLLNAMRDAAAKTASIPGIYSRPTLTKKIAAALRAVSAQGGLTPAVVEANMKDGLARATDLYTAAKQADPTLAREDFAQALYRFHKAHGDQFNYEGPTGNATEKQVFTATAADGKHIRYFGFSEKTRGAKRVQYHGTSQAFTPGSIYSMEQHKNLYGPGLYTTDSPEIARSYTKKGGGTAPTVYAVKHAKTNPNLLDLEKPLPPDVYTLFSEGDYGHGMNPDMKGTEVYEEWKANLANDGLTTHDAEEHMHGITAELQKLGYDGYSHTGGAKTGGAAHHVEIYFADPTEGKVPVTLSEVRSVPSQIVPKKAGSHSGAIRLGGPVNPNSPQAKYGPAIAKALGAEEIASAATLGKQAAAVVKAVVSPSTMTPEAGQEARIIRTHSAEYAREQERMMHAATGLVKVFEKMPEAEQIQFIDSVEHGQSQPHPELQAVANVLRNALDKKRDEVIALGTGALENYIENYFPRQWKQPDAAQKIIARSFTGGASLEGKKSFLKKRTIPTLRTGIAAGLEPLTTNPLDLFMMKIGEMNRFIMGQKILQEMHEQGFLTFERSNVPPPGMAAINDKVAKVFRPSQATVKDDYGNTLAYAESGEHVVLNNKKWGETEGQIENDKGRIQAGQWVAPEAVARVLNNFLSPGLSANPLYQILRGTNNLMNMAELGLSLFHMTGTTINAAMSKASLSLQQTTRGEIAPAAMNVLKTPTAVFEYLASGNKVLQEYLKPGASPDMDLMVQAIIDGGGRVSMDRAFRTNFVKTMRQAFRSGHHAKGVLTAIPALVEATAIPIMQWYVPRLKLGAYVDMARSEMASKHWQTASVDEKRQVLSEAWDSIDNRFGQLVYDNLFWNKTLKDISLIAVRSVGWNLGTIRELGGAAADIPGTPARLKAGRGISPRIGYAVTLPVITALLGALYNYAHGRKAETLEDYMNPQDSHGDRIALPTYWKDVQSYSKRPVRTAWNKKSPLVSTVLDMLANKDFLGKPIRNENDPLVKQAQQEASHIAGLFEPFAIKDMLESHKKGASTEAQAERFFGLTPIHAAKGDRGQSVGAR